MKLAKVYFAIANQPVCELPFLLLHAKSLGEARAYIDEKCRDMKLYHGHEEYGIAEIGSVVDELKKGGGTGYGVLAEIQVGSWGVH